MIDMKETTATGKGRVSPSFLLTELNKLTVTPWQTEHRFCPGRMWRFDFANPDIMLAIEIEGAIFANGRHSRGAGMLGDMEKYNKAELYGWTILRYSAKPCAYLSKIDGKETEASKQRRAEWIAKIRKEVTEYHTGIVDGQRTLDHTCACQHKILSEAIE